MKRKNYIKIIGVATAFLLGLTSMSACNKGCEHVYKWSVIEAPTCSTTGKRQGLCGLCGDVLIEELSVDPEAHSYGDWSLQLPDEEHTGKATKTCEHDVSHILEVTLPPIDEEGLGYTSAKITTPPTAFNKGIRTYVLEHEAGNISFEVDVEPTGIVTVADAVAAAQFNRSQVRKGEGLTSAALGYFEPSTFAYEYGNNYSHIDNNDDNEERWYTLEDDGELFAVVLDKRTGTYNIDATDNKRYLEGFSFQIGRASGGRRYYGAEDLFKGVYEWGETDANKDFKQSIAPYGLAMRGTFSFGNLGSSDYFCHIEVSFELSPERALKHIILHSYAYSRADCTINAETNTATLKANAKILYDEYIEFTQTLLSELTPEEVENVPVSPYSKSSMQVQGFDISYGATLLGEETPLKINANVGYYFTFSNITPQPLASFQFDPLKIYQRIRHGDKYEDKEVDYVPMNGTIASYYDSSRGTYGAIFVRALVSGDVTLVIKTESGFEKAIAFDITPAAPSSLRPSFYEYTDSGYIWNNTSTATVYVGQALEFRALVPDNESQYTDPAHRAAVTTDNRDTATIEEGERNGEAVHVFKATAVGTYGVTIASTRSSAKTVLTVNVIAAPTALELFGKEYTGKLEYPSRSAVTVRFTPGATISEGTVTVTTAGSSERLSYTYENGVLTTAHVGGADLGFTVSLNVAYRIVVTHPTGFGDHTETVVLTEKPVQ